MTRRARRAAAALSLALAMAGAPGARAQLGQWTTYTAADGLDRSVVFQAIQDRDGFIWASTKVLNRFDGRRFQQFSDGGTMYVDRLAQFWVGSLNRNVLLRYDGTGFHVLMPADGLPDAHVEAMFQDRNGALWLGTTQTRPWALDEKDPAQARDAGRGVCRYEPEQGTIRCFDESSGLGGNNVSSIAEDGAGNLWFGLSSNRAGSGRGIARFDGKRFQVYTTADGLPGNEVRAILCRRQGELLVGTADGLCRWNGQRFEKAVLPGAPSTLHVAGLFEDRDGRLWIGTEGDLIGGHFRSEGALRYDGQRLTAFRQGVLGTTNVPSIYEDRDGNYWLSSMGGGLVRYDPSFFRAREDEPLLHAGALDVAIDARGPTFFITEDGKVVLEEGDPSGVWVRSGCLRPGLRRCWPATPRGTSGWRPERHSAPGTAPGSCLRSRRPGRSPWPGSTTPGPSVSPPRTPCCGAGRARDGAWLAARSCRLGTSSIASRIAAECCGSPRRTGLCVWRQTARRGSTGARTGWAPTAWRRTWARGRTGTSGSSASTTACTRSTRTTSSTWASSSASIACDFGACWSIAAAGRGWDRGATACSGSSRTT